MSHILDPDQTRRFVGSDMGPNCLQKLSVDDTSGQRVYTKIMFYIRRLYFSIVSPKDDLETLNLDY